MWWLGGITCRRQVLGEDHVDTLVAAFNLGVLHLVAREDAGTGEGV